MTTDIQARLREAERLQAAGDFARAESAFGALLAEDPDSPYLHLRLSESRQSLGQYRDSRAAALAAEAGMRRTERWQALPYVTMRLLAFDERPLMKRAIKAADWSRPEVLMQAPVLSQHLWLSGGYDEAIDLIDRTLQRAHPSALLHYSRANALRYGGRVDEATEALEDCLALDPGHPQAHWTLAYHAPSKVPGSRVDRIRRAKDRLAPSDPGQVFLDYALFKELDDAGDTAGAWLALERAMALKRQGLRYDAAAQEAAIEKLIETASPVGGGEGFAEGHVPLFVVGLPRTGTTLLERILSKHDEIAAGGELSDFTHALSFETNRFLANPPSEEDQAAIAGVRDWAAVGRRYLERTAHLRGDKPILVDKNPSNIFHAVSIARALPQARILCLVRDSMDTCFSNFKELFPGQGYGYSYDFAEMATQNRQFRQLAGALQRALPGRFEAISYEELATSPKRVADRIVRALGLPPQLGLTETSRDDRPVLSASATQVRQAVHTGNIGGWRRYARQLEPLREMVGED
jgi:tetratricopeptide (TPR) repeat protein